MLPVGASESAKKSCGTWVMTRCPEASTARLRRPLFDTLRSPRSCLPIDDSTYQGLAKYFSVPQIIEICLNVGLAQITNRFNATFLTEVDDYIVDANQKAAH